LRGIIVCDDFVSDKTITQVKTSASLGKTSIVVNDDVLLDYTDAAGESTAGNFQQIS
jgi:hypothetical protein